MPNIDLSILNQRQTPAFYADVFANRPAAGFVGRIFISTNTFAFYRDNGTSWDLIGGPGTGTVTGSGAAGQVAFWSGSSLISGENNLWWDSTNNHFGINTNTPGTAADIHHDQSTILQLNQTTATNDTRIAFQNGGSSKWRVGNFYSAGSNDYKVNDAVLNINRFTIKSSSGQTFVGDETTSSGLFVVNNSSGDAHIVALGATAPSIRVRNAGVGATLQFGLGLATTTNNFIQGATGGEFCIFNDSLTAQPILFGIKDAGLGNTQEAARISAARNFLVGTTTDAGQKLQVTGTALITGAATFNSSFTAQTGEFISAGQDGSVGSVVRISTTSTNPNARNWGIVNSWDNFGDLTFRVSNAQGGNALSSGSSIMALLRSGNVGIGTTSPNRNTEIISSGGAVLGVSSSANGAGILYGRIAMYTNAASNTYIDYGGEIRSYSGAGIDNSDLRFYTANATPSVERMRITNGGNLLIGTTTDTGDKLQVSGTALITGSLTTGSPIGIKGTTPFIQWLNNSSTRLGYIQHNASNLVYNADTGQHIFNQAIQISNTVTAAVGIASTHKVSILINGVQYYLLASNV